MFYEQVVEIRNSSPAESLERGYLVCDNVKIIANIGPHEALSCAW